MPAPNIVLALLIGLLSFTTLQTAPLRSASPAPRPRPAPAAVLSGGLPRSRALVIALPGGSWVDPDARRLAERCRDDLSSAAQRAGLRLLVPVGQEPDRAAKGSQGHDYEVPWLSAEGEAQVLALIDDEVAHHRADPSRIYFAGHGAGATAALLLAARHTQRIAAVAAWAGAPSPLWDHDGRVVGLVGDPVAGLADMPVFLWTARDDPYLDRAALGLLVDGLRAARGREGGVPLMWTDDESGGHGFGAAGPLPGLEFLKRQRRPQPP